MCEEIWNDIPGYEGLYMISNKGCVKSLNYKGTGKEHIMKPENCHGYNQVMLSKNGKTKMFSIHRIVATVFIPNPNNWPCVNHKNEDKSDNCVNNLEWCTYSFNNSYGTRIQRIIETRNLNNSKGAEKPILQFTKDCKFVAEYKSIKECERQTGFDSRHISQVLNRRRKSLYGYIWKFKDSD